MKQEKANVIKMNAAVAGELETELCADVRCVLLALNAVNGCRATDVPSGCSGWTIDHGNAIEAMMRIAKRLDVSNESIGLECDDHNTPPSMEHSGTQ